MRGILVGYESDSGMYQVYHPQVNRVVITHDVIIYENEFNSASNASEAVREQLTGEKPTKVRSTFVDDEYKPPPPFPCLNENANVTDEPIAPINGQPRVSRDQPVTSRSQSHHLRD